MRRVVPWLVAAFVACTPGPNAGESAERFRAGARHVKEDAAYLITFPKRPTRRGVAWTAGIGAGIVALIFLDDEIRREAQESRNDTLDRWEERIEPLGGARNVAVGALTTYGLGRLVRHEPTAETGRCLIEALLFTEAFDSAAKGLFGREKPGSGGSSDFFHGSSFFPSGHTARAFAAATVLAERHGPRAAWIAYPVATLVGLFRIESDSHWASDVLAGGALGHVIARSVVRRREGRRSGSAAVRIAPAIDPGRRAAGVTLSFKLGTDLFSDAGKLADRGTEPGK